MGRPVCKEEKGVPGCSIAPADSKSIHATASCTIRPTTESSELPSASRLRECSHDSRGRSYVEPAIFIAATRQEHSGLPSGNAAADSLQECSFPGPTETSLWEHHCSGPTRTFCVWSHRLMNNWHFSLLLFASRIFPDKMMEYIVKWKLSLITILWSYVRILCICVDNYVQGMWHSACMWRAAKPDFEESPWYDNRMKSNFPPKLWRLRVLLGHIDYYITVVFTLVKESVRRKTVKWRASSLWRLSTNMNFM
jgi:hypothetical protein